MQIKSLDGRQPQVGELRALLGRDDVSVQARQRIEREIRSVEAGQRGEAEAAYHIEFHYGPDPDIMTLHDLRIKCDGRVAQIDHLIITRLFEFWVCESKKVAEGVEINEQGEWCSYHGDRKVGIPSPIEQNKRHIAVLQDVFAKRLVTMPTRIGSPVKAALRSLVLVSVKAQITRPMGPSASRVEGLESVIKVDQVKTKIDASDAKHEQEGQTATPPTAVTAATIENVARQLAGLHSPLTHSWARRFGLPERPLQRTSPQVRTDFGRIVFPGMSASANRRTESTPYCESCGDNVSYAVVEYCRDRAALLEGSILCVACQDEFYPDRY